VLIGEPARTQYDLNFSVLGIPVRIHPMFWLVAVVLGASSNKARVILVWVAAFLVSILCHEFGHAMVQRAYGARPWITLYGLGGLASYHPSELRRSRHSPTVQQILISLAGPGAGFVLAAAIIGLLVVSGHPIEVRVGAPYGIDVRPEGIVGSTLLTYLIDFILFISIIWGLINLMPVYPLDGGHIAREIFLAVNPRDGIRQSLWLSAIAAVALAIIGALEWGSFFMALLFGYLAFTSYTTLRSYEGQAGPW